MQNVTKAGLTNLAELRGWDRIAPPEFENLNPIPIGLSRGVIFYTTDTEFSVLEYRSGQSHLIFKAKEDERNFSDILAGACPITPERYVEKAGQFCPVCGSNQIEGGPFEADSSTAYQEVTCLDCDSGWNDIYNLVGYGDLETS